MLREILPKQLEVIVLPEFRETFGIRRQVFPSLDCYAVCGRSRNGKDHAPTRLEHATKLVHVISKASRYMFQNMVVQNEIKMPVWEKPEIVGEFYFLAGCAVRPWVGVRGKVAWTKNLPNPG